MELILIAAVAGLILWALSSAAKVREREGGSCCGGGCHGKSSDSCSSDGGCGSGD